MKLVAGLVASILVFLKQATSGPVLVVRVAHITELERVSVMKGGVNLPMNLMLAALLVVSVLVRTDLGEFVVEIDVDRAPVTAANFLRYVDSGRYDGGQFHRTVTLANQPNDAVTIEVVQAGRAPGGERWPSIPLERTSATGLRHVNGAISMARSGPDTASSDFFICIHDQPSLDFGGARNPDGQGFAAFGRVVQGMEVVERIHGAANTDAQKLTPPIRIVSIARMPSR